MHLRTLKSDLLLLLTAIIWGFAFVAQRVGMDHVGPFTFNGVRFVLGGLSLIPLLVITLKTADHTSTTSLKTTIFGGSLAGLALFMGVSLQQIGLIYTTAGKAGFITGLYVVIVPIVGMFLKQRIEIGTWLGVALAAIGLYFLSITETFRISYGDFLELIGAFCWVAHIQVIGRFSRQIHPLKLAFSQCLVCSLLSLITAILVEQIALQNIFKAGIPILYGGVLSVGVAYTLQVVAQRNTPPAHAAILLSLETVFAVIGGWIFLKETLSFRELFGCICMFAGMLVSQFNLKTVHFALQHRQWRKDSAK